MHAKRIKRRFYKRNKPIREGMNNLPKATTLSQFPSMTAYDEDDEEEGKKS